MWETRDIEDGYLCVESEDYRNFLIKQEVKLTDEMRASLVYHNRQITQKKRIEALEEISRKTTNFSLKEQIAKIIIQERVGFEKFQDNDGSAYYALSIISEEKNKIYGIYTSYHMAVWEGLKTGEAFGISKKLFDDVDEKKVQDLVLGYAVFHKELMYGGFYGSGMPRCANKDKEIPSFEEAFIELPLMFRRGDIVHIIGTDKYGIVDAPENDEEEALFLKTRGDYTDFQVPVNLFFDGKNYLSVFSHEHVAPTKIEYVRLENEDWRKGFLEYMKKTLYDNYLFGGSGRDEGRISLVMESLEKVWRQYPNMRLCQLILNICGQKDLFSVEDEVLLQHLQGNIFPIKGE